jgi:hypothetical protein
MTRDLRTHHYRKEAAIELLNGHKLDSEHPHVFREDFHGDGFALWNPILLNTIKSLVTWNYLHYFLDTAKWNRTRIVVLMLVFSFSILDEPQSIVADHKPP